MKPDHFTVYVPVEGARLRIDPGSGIVATEGLSEPEWRVLIDFEGNRHNAANIVTYADRLHHAAGRARERYPTMARISAPVGAVTAVGIYYYEHGRFQPAGGLGLVRVAKWLGCWDGERITKPLSDEFRATHRAALR